MTAVITIEKVVDAVAWRGLHPSSRYIGTKKSPPPRPNPLKTPASKLFYIMSLMLSKTGFLTYLSYSASDCVGAIHCFSVSKFL